MDLPVPQEFRILQSGNQPQNSLLFRKSQVILKPNEIVAGRAQILLPELAHCVWPPARSWVLQADGFQRSEAKRIATPSCELFNWQASLKKRNFLIKVRFVGLCREDRIYESFVL